MIRFTTSPSQVCRDLPAWDAFNRLSMADDLDVNPSGKAIRYAYDTGNRRVAKVTLDVSASSTLNDLYLYGGWQVLGERRTPSLQTNPSTTLHRQFVYGNYIDEPLVMDTDDDNDGDCHGTQDSRLFYHTNTLFSVYALTNEDGEIVEAYAYDPYGKHVVVKDGDSDGKVNFDISDSRIAMGRSDFDNRYTFTGRRYDADSGLHYYRNRYYYAWLARFISRDPLGYVDGMSLYTAYYSMVHVLDPFGTSTRKTVTVYPHKYGDPMDRKRRGLRGIVKEIIEAQKQIYIDYFDHNTDPDNSDNSRYKYVHGVDRGWVESENQYQGECVALAGYLQGELMYSGQTTIKTKASLLVRPDLIKKWALTGGRDNGRRVLPKLRDHWAVVISEPLIVNFEVCEKNGEYLPFRDENGYIIAQPFYLNDYSGSDKADKKYLETTGSNPSFVKNNITSYDVNDWIVLDPTANDRYTVSHWLNDIFPMWGSPDSPFFNWFILAPRIVFRVRK